MVLLRRLDRDGASVKLQHLSTEFGKEMNATVYRVEGVSIPGIKESAMQKAGQAVEQIFAVAGN